jgi:WD40 repeat protein
LWDVKKGRIVDELRGLRELAEWLVYSPDGRFLAAASFGGNVAIWDLATRREPHFIGQNRHVNLAFSPNSKTLAGGSGDDVILWNVATGQEILRLAHPCSFVAFSPDGQILASAGAAPGAMTTDVILWLAPQEEVTAESSSSKQ